MLSESKTAARRGKTGGGFGGVMLGGVDAFEATPNRPAFQHRFTEDLTEPELRDVRAVWWRLRAAGVDLPAERGVIALSGGAR